MTFWGDDKILAYICGRCVSSSNLLQYCSLSKIWTSFAKLQLLQGYYWSYTRVIFTITAHMYWNVKNAKTDGLASLVLYIFFIWLMKYIRKQIYRSSYAWSLPHKGNKCVFCKICTPIMEIKGIAFVRW